MPRDILLKSIQGMDGVYCFITDKIDSEFLEAAGKVLFLSIFCKMSFQRLKNSELKLAGPNLKVIGTMSVGHDHIDVGAVKAKKVKLGYTPDVLTDATADLTVAVLLAASRRLFEAHQNLIKYVFGIGVA